MQSPTFIMMGSRMTAAISLGFSRKRRSTVSRSLKVAIFTLSMLALGTPLPPETGFGFLMSPKSSAGGCGFTLSPAAVAPAPGFLLLRRPDHAEGGAGRPLAAGALQ